MHIPNAARDVLDVQLIIRELEGYERRIANLPGREAEADRRHVRGLIEKLYRVECS